MTGWTILRTVYLLAGMIVVGHSIYVGMWYGILLGGYIILMGLLGLGCAGSACTLPHRTGDTDL